MEKEGDFGKLNGVAEEEEVLLDSDAEKSGEEPEDDTPRQHFNRPRSNKKETSAARSKIANLPDVLKVVRRMCCVVIKPDFIYKKKLKFDLID